MADRICVVDGCEKNRHGRHRMCTMHCHRMVRTGRLDLAPRPKKPCSVDGCGKIANSRGLCKAHVTRLHRTGTVELIPRPPAEFLTYRGLHSRLESQRGKAADHPCVDCGGCAVQWSYDYGDPDPLRDAKHGSPYSLDLQRYAARCGSCHQVHDRAHGARSQDDVPQAMEG